MIRRCRAGGDSGETLLELIVSISILGVCVVAIASGMALSIKLSDTHRSQSVAGSDLHNYAESIEKYVAADGYANCASTGSYAPGTVGFSASSGYTASVINVGYLTGAAFSGSCGTDSGAQQLTLQEKSTDNRAVESLVIVVRKPCSPTSAAC